MKIELIGKRIVNIALNQIDGTDTDKKSKTAKVTLNNELYSNVKDEKLFRVRYHVVVIIESRLQIEITYDFDFRSEVEFSEDLAKSHEIRTIVPSMAYPYIKTFAEQLMLLSNLGSFNLPYFDFFSSPMEPNNS
ncbi:hypothetical protein MXL54_00260 [Enterobacteriaceae bacterium G50]|nr:hypothetical protein [Enterobacteriaceae bacterium G50]